MVTRPSEADHAVTAMVKSAMPTGSRSRCQARSFHVEGSEKRAFRRLRKPPVGDLYTPGMGSPSTSAARRRSSHAIQRET